MRSLSASAELKMNPKTQALLEVLGAEWSSPPAKVLVVGCGTGWEAGVLARSLRAETIGIDIGDEFAFDHVGSAPAVLQVMDAQSLDFPDNVFDLVYSFHALEHISNPCLALREMARVLKPGGTFMVGTPNKSRLVGYIGSSASFLNKVRWNINDLMMKVQGKWSNEAGAHAGFSEKELGVMCSRAFGSDARSVSRHYYVQLYGSRLINALSLLRVAPFVLPCVYLVGEKR